jgi:hypothetical protein
MSNQEGALIKYTDLEVAFNDNKEILWFYVMDLGEDRAIFGFLWLLKFKPTIDWEEGSIKGGTVRIKTTNEELPKWVRISQAILTARRIAQKAKIEEGEEIHWAIGKTNVAQQWAEAAHRKKNDLVTELSIPAQYSDFANIFSETATRRFPPPREDDHVIDLKEGAPDTFT